MHKIDFNFVATLYDSFERSYSQNDFDFLTLSDLLTFWVALVKVTQNLIDWLLLDYVQPATVV